jgi:2-keto-4-pentenoate hydratase
MLDKDQIAAASQVLVQHWRDGSKLDALETRLRPQSRSEGYAVQAALGDQMFGWKIAATSEAGQKHIIVAGPLAGRIRAAGISDDGHRCPKIALPTRTWVAPSMMAVA